MSISVESLFQSKEKEGKAGISIFDESLLQSSSTYHLYCSIDHQFIGISLVDIDKTRFCAFEAFHFQKPFNNDQLSKKISKLPEESSILRKINFQKVSVQVVNNNYTFVPTALFRKEDMEQYYFFNQSKEGEVIIMTDIISPFDTMNIFSIPQEINSSLRKIFDQFNIHHHATSLINATRMESRKNNEESIFVHFHSGFMDVIITKGKSLLLCNTFNYKSNEDALYYLLFVCEQLTLNLEQVPILLSGEIENKSGLTELLHNYIPNISFSGRIRSARFTYGFDNLPAHFYYSVFSHILCES